jgi:hypothetical protein
MERAGSDLTAFGETVVFLDYFKNLSDPRQADRVIYGRNWMMVLLGEKSRDSERRRHRTTPLRKRLAPGWRKISGFAAP